MEVLLVGIILQLMLLTWILNGIRTASETRNDEMEGLQKRLFYVVEELRLLREKHEPKP